MKQLLSLFLFLLPCLALAQYPSNGNQKITLGEQTTADGLIYRGVLADTVRKPSIDTMAYMVLDTTTNIMWHYKKATSNAWLRLNLLPSDTASMLTNYWRSGRFSGTLPVVNGGTGASVRTFVDTINTQTVNGAKTFTSTVTATRFNPTANTAAGTGMFAPTSTSLGFSTDGTQKLTILSNGNVGIGETNPSKPFFLNKQINGETSFTTLNNSSGTSAYVLNEITNGTTALTLFHTGVNFTTSGRYLQNSSIIQSSGIGGLTLAFSNSLGKIIFYGESSELMRLNYNGNFGIGVIDPTEKLHVVGNARITAVGAGAYANDLNITSTGVLTTASSDEKYKYNILPINYGLNTILQLNPVNFQWIKGEENDLGFIAQDVAEIIPEAVDTNWNSDLLMRYESIIPILTKAIQEQQALIKALEQRIINLENK
jgi:hypothetical protein